MEGKTVWAKGSYDDKFVKRDGRWFFAARTYHPGQSGYHDGSRR